MTISTPTRIVVNDSVTTLDASTRGSVLIAGSHGGIYAAYLAARAGVRAVVLNDAGVGRDRAGIGGIDWLAGFGIAAAAIDSRTARIGDGADMLRRGIVSFANAVASEAGVIAGQAAKQCLETLASRAPVPSRNVSEVIEGRHAIARGAGNPAVWAVDSVSLIEPADAGAIVVTGSHGALLGGRPETVLPNDVIAAVFNDAGGGIDGAGYTRLPALDARGIAGATVAGLSARIGDGRSTCADGVVSRCNDTAHALGAREGMTTIEFVDAVASAIRRRSAR